MQPLPHPWSQHTADVLTALDVAPERGLRAHEIQARRRAQGANVLRRTAPRPLLGILVAQLRSFIVLLLAAAATISLAFGQLAEGIAVVAVIVINTAIGFFTELRAVRSMEALRALGSVHTRVRRNGRGRRIPADQVVVGDLVLLEAGDVVTADLRLVEASRLQANESSLTGESVPVTKDVKPVAADAPLGERASMLFKGTSVTRGTGVGVVVAVGMGSELGRISALIEGGEDEETPLERRLEGLGRTLAWLSLGFVVLVAGAGALGGKPLLLVVETAIALAVATVPEGLPIVATVALARGMWRMARRNALIEHLPAVETLGSTSIILTDKTGTLTENQMTVTRLLLPGRNVEISGTGLSTDGTLTQDGAPLDATTDRAVRELLALAALCTDAELHPDSTAVGDPMEVALLVAAEKVGLKLAELRARRPELREEAFDPQTRMMATFNRRDDGIEVAVKGAPEAVIAACRRVDAADGSRALDAAAREGWVQQAHALGDAGMRVLAVASKTATDETEAPYSGLTLQGLLALVDPPRMDVRSALDTCAAAGIRVVMVTGDQAGTAGHVARELGLARGAAAMAGADIDRAAQGGADARQRLLGSGVIARCSPEQKLRLLQMHQESGAVVAMIGDGVNDAPALHRADIGVAMGQRGTQVAREAADMVLRDDRFQTITVAIEQGRAIFDNIRTFVVYLISCNLSEILCVGLSSLAGAPLPILPLQILFLNLVTDVFPALALGVSEGHRNIMRQPPRDPKEPFLAAVHWRRIAGFSVLLTAPVLASLAIARLLLDMDTARAVTVSFATLAMGQLAHVFNMPAAGAPLLVNHVTRNPWVWGAVTLCVVLVALGVYVPLLANVLQTRDPGLEGWLVVLALGATPALVGLPLRAAENARLRRL
ncbi:MAG: cation-transporting P-type ATPase [Myxococcales bacterium]|jgi:Ca2+-transporting ATPase